MPPKKATSEQYKGLVDLVANSSCIRFGKGSPEQKREAWEAISQALNALGGVEKNGEGWKKAFTEMKSHTKLKTRTKKTLNETEKKCAEVTGLYTSCEGLQDVKELGLTEAATDEVYTVEEIEIPFQVDLEAEERKEDDTEELDEKEVEEVGKATTSQQPKALTTEAPKQHRGFKKNPSKSTLLQLEDHMQSTNKGLNNIANSIQSVADAINNVAAAIRETK